MKNYILFLVAIGLSGCCQTTYSKHHNKIQDTVAAVKYFEDEMNFTTNPGGVKAVLGSKDITIVDVRREADFKAGHIPGAINLPFDKWDRFEGTLTEFLGLRKDGYNYVYCYELLCNLGQKAAKKFASLGYPAKEMKGGFQSWKDHKYKIEK
jgi:hypothetical protein